MGACSLLLSIMFFLFMHDYNMNKQAIENLKFVCEEASVAGSLFIDNEQYGEGKIIFNKIEATKAIDAVIISMLNLQTDMTPKSNSYWREKIERKIQFFDNSNTTFPCDFIDSDTGYYILMRGPHVIVTINAGKPRYTLSLLKNGPDSIRSSGHEWVGVGR